VCEGGECTKQIPALWSGPPTAALTWDAVYQSTGCFAPVCANCAKCNLKVSITSGEVQEYVILDSTGRPVPNVPVVLTTYFMNSGVSAYLQDAMSNDNGQVFVTITAPFTGLSPWGGVDDAAYPCDACSGKGATGTFGGELGTLTLAVMGDSEVAIETIVTFEVDYTETVNNTFNGCTACGTLGL